jgi:hypothetical protein
MAVAHSIKVISRAALEVRYACDQGPNMKIPIVKAQEFLIKTEEFLQVLSPPNRTTRMPCRVYGQEAIQIGHLCILIPQDAAITWSRCEDLGSENTITMARGLIHGRNAVSQAIRCE